MPEPLVVFDNVVKRFGTFEAVTGAFEWKRHSIYFAALFVLNIATVFQVARLHDRVGDSSRIDQLGPETS